MALFHPVTEKEVTKAIVGSFYASLRSMLIAMSLLLVADPADL